MINTYKVTIPLNVTFEIDAASGPATEEMIRTFFYNAFVKTAPYDPLCGARIDLQHGSNFTVSRDAQLKSAVLTDDCEIEVKMT